MEKVYVIAWYCPHRCSEDGPFTLTDSTNAHVASSFDKAVDYCLDSLEDLRQEEEGTYFSICCELVDVDMTEASGGQVATITTDGEVNDFRDVMASKGYVT